MATAEQNTISTEELFGNQAPQVVEPTIAQPEAQTVSTEELFGGQDKVDTSVGVSLNPQSDEKISTQQEEPLGTKIASEIGKFFFASDTTNQRFQTSYEISQEFDIPLDKVYDDQLYRNIVSDTFSTFKPEDRVLSEVASVSFMAAAAQGLILAPIHTVKALGYFAVANEAVSLAISGKDYDFNDTKTLVDLVPKNSAPWMYAVAEASDYILKGAAVGAAFKGEAKLTGRVKKGVNDIFSKYKKEMVLEGEKTAPKELPTTTQGATRELPFRTQSSGVPKDTTNIPVSTKLPLKQELIPKSDQQLPSVPKDGMPSKTLTPQEQQKLVNTPLEGAKSSLEVRAKIASDLGVEPKDLVQGGVGGFAKWQSDGHVVDSHPVVKWGVQELTKENIEADERHLQQVKLINAVAKKARKGGGKRLSMEEDPTGVSTWQKDVREGKTGPLWDRLVPTDPLVNEFLESPNKAEVAKRMTKEELDYALVLHEGWNKMFDLAYEAEKINSKLDDYVTHIRRTLPEAWKTTGDFWVAFRETRDNFLHDMAKFRVRDPKTGRRMPFEKSFKYAQERKGGIKPTTNMAKAYLTYNETFEKMMAYNKVMPAIIEGIKSIKPVDPTPMEQRAYEMLEKFVDQWGKNKKGIPAEWAVDPQSEFAFYLKSARMFVSIMDLGLNPIIGAAAAVGEGSMNYMALGPKRVKLGVDRGLTKEGKDIIKKYESWIGRSPWSEMSDASHQITDSTMKAMFSFFQISAVEANKHALLGLMSEAEFKAGEVSYEQLAKFRLLLNRHRYQKGMESIAEGTVEGKFFGQYRFSWGLPPLVTSMKNFKAGWQRVFSGKKMTDQQTAELQNLGSLMFFATMLAVGYYPDKDDESVSAKTRRKIARESFTTLGAAQMLLSPGSSRVSGLNLNIVMGTYETLKGILSNSPDLIEKGTKKLKSVVVPGAMKWGIDLLSTEKIKPPSKQKRSTDVGSRASALEIIEDTAPNRR